MQDPFEALTVTACSIVVALVRHCCTLSCCRARRLCLASSCHAHSHLRLLTASDAECLPNVQVLNQLLFSNE